MEYPASSFYWAGTPKKLHQPLVMAPEAYEMRCGRSYPTPLNVGEGNEPEAAFCHFCLEASHLNEADRPVSRAAKARKKLKGG